MLFRKDIKFKPNPKKEDLVFQILDFKSDNYVEYSSEGNMSDDSDEESGKGVNIPQYRIRLYGVNKNGNSISATVNNFPPYFYVQIPDNWSKKYADMLFNKIKDLLKVRNYSHSIALQSYSYQKKKCLKGFTNNKLFKFIRLTFMNTYAKNACQNLFHDKDGKKKPIYIDGISKKPQYFDLLETNIDPILRFIHIRNIKPAGWISIPKGSYTINKPKTTRCQLDISCEWNCIEPYHMDDIAPLIIAAFDIECDSSHGDFPMAKKKYKKLATNIVDELSKIEKNIIKYRENGEKSKAEDYYELLKNKKSELIQTFIKIGFDLIKCDIYNIALVYTKENIKPDEDTISIVADEIANILKVKDIKREQRIEDIDKILNNNFPPVEGDKVIQIGTTINRYGERDCFLKHIITLGSCDPIEGSIVEQYKTEKEVLLAWTKFIQKLDPDIITGYNIFGFDFAFIMDRVEEVMCNCSAKYSNDVVGNKYGKSKHDDHCKTNEFAQLSRNLDVISILEEKTLASAGLGHNELKYLTMEGRVLFDLLKVVQNGYKLESYKLDDVAFHFTNQKKHDVSPKEIFALQKGSSSDRNVIAKYCIQDCELCNFLSNKLECVTNNIGMANVCNVPLSFIYLRGQGIKIFSLVSKICRESNILIPLPKGKPTNDEDKEGYEGAIVLDPKPGIYIDHPVSVLDYSSLYPSCMIAENLSHDSIVLDEEYMGEEGGKLLKELGFDYVDIEYDNYKYIKKGQAFQKVINELEPKKVCRYVQFPNNEKGIIPKILMNLLGERKKTRKKIEYKTITTSDSETYKGLLSEKNNITTILQENGEKVEIKNENINEVNDTYTDFQKAVLDGLQLAFKVTANSLYGSIGASTSQIYRKEIAASTTAVGRNMLLEAKDFVEKNYEGSECVYGDTDSIFINFNPKDGNGNKLKGKEALQKSIDMGLDVEKNIQHLFKKPHKLEYEKSFWPFILLSKKRYVGDLYEFDVNKSSRKSMGIVLKRRDNAKIVKHIYGGIIDIILKEHDIEKSKIFLKGELEKLANGQFSLDQLIVSKSLRADYKDPDRIAHKVLADRMSERDPGNKPNPSDRIPYVYIEKKEKKGVNILQGDRIEHPNFITENKLTPDYRFYITNQIMKPVMQIYELQMKDPKKLFEDVLRTIDNRRNKVSSITNWFSSLKS